MRGIHIKHGLTATDITHVRTDQKMLEVIQEVIIVADHSKFSQMGSVSFAPISAVSIVVTDNEAPLDQIEALRDLGVKVIAV